MKHLSDELIQQYLDTTELTDRSVVENHLMGCFECQEKLEQYQELYQHLSIESESVPNDAFNYNVLAAVERIESKKKSRQLTQIAGALSTLLMLVLSLSYFGLISWQGLLSPVKSASANLFDPFYQTIGQLVEKLNGNLALLAFAGLVLLLFHLLDYSLLKVKANRT